MSASKPALPQCRLASGGGAKLAAMLRSCLLDPARMKCSNKNSYAQKNGCLATLHPGLASLPITALLQDEHADRRPGGRTTMDKSHLCVRI